MNYYKKIAEMLGVELGEEFRLEEFRLKENKTKNILIPRYKITQEEGLMYSVNRNEFDRSTMLMSIINGRYSIVKLPWKPKYGEKYWSYSTKINGTCCNTFWELIEDYAMWESGNCFRTEEEAKTKGKEIMEKLVKEYEEA